MKLTRGIPDEGCRSQALVKLGHVDEARELARGIVDARSRDMALAAITRHLTELGHVEEALGVARSIGDEWNRSEALAELGCVEEALKVARRMAVVSSRSQALSKVAQHMSKLPNAQLLRLWEDTLRTSSTISRGDLLPDLSALSTVIEVLGGPVAIEETCRAIEDVGRWWP